MASATQTAIVGFEKTFETTYGAAPSWLQALLSALESALPAILAACGVAAAPASIQQALTDSPDATAIKLHSVCRNAGVPLIDRPRAVAALIAAVKGTSEADLTALLVFASAS